MSVFRFPAPTPSGLGDHDVPADGTHLSGCRVALLVTGGIAAMKVPFVARALRRQGATVVAFTSEEALRYVTVEALEWSTVNPVVQRLTAAAEHLSDARPFDAYLVAPATYNTLNKIAAGIADSVVTSAVASALGRLEAGRTAVLVAPTMHGSLHNRILVESLRRLHDLGVRVIPPRDAYGKHNLPDDGTLVTEVARAVSRSPLRGRRVLVTGGTTPVDIDGVHRVSREAHGRLGLAIATHFHLRGADTLLIHGGALPAASVVPHRIVHTHDEYRAQVVEALDHGYDAGVFAAAVTQVKVEDQAQEKAPTMPEGWVLSPAPDAHLTNALCPSHLELYRVIIEPQVERSHETRMEWATIPPERSLRVLVPRSTAPSDRIQRAWLLSLGEALEVVGGEERIAEAIAHHLEKVLAQR